MDLTTFKTLEFRRKFWKIVGAEISIVDPASDALVGFINMRGWRLREDIRVYTDRSMTTELFRIKARSVIDFTGTYDVFDGGSGEEATPRFSLRRKGLSSTFVRDQWLVFGTDEVQKAGMIETSGALAIFRRWIGVIPIFGEIIDLALAFAPQSYRLTNDEGKELAVILRRKNPFIVKLQLDMSRAEAKPVDEFIAPALCALISVLEVDK